MLEIDKEYRKHIDLDYYKNNPFPISPILYPHNLKPRINYEGDINDTHIRFGQSKYGRYLFSKLHEKSDYKLLLYYAKLHGRFLEKFFRRDLNLRVRKSFIESKYEFEEFQDLYSEHYQKSIDTIIFKHFIADITFDFFKVSLYNLIDKKVYKEILKWERKNLKDKKCEICGNEYNILKLPDWAYYGSNGNVNICFECPIPKSPTKEEITRLIPKLIDSSNFIPNSDFGLLNNSFTSKINSNKWTDVAKITIQMGVSGFSNETIKELFGSWFKALVEAKVLENDVLKTGRGIKCIAKSGNECNSLDEMFIDNWLYENGFKIIKEPRYPYHEKYNPNNLRRADWLVNDYYIEYFGLAGDEKYDTKTKEKILLVKELNLKLIAVFREDLNSIDEKFIILKR